MRPGGGDGITETRRNRSNAFSSIDFCSGFSVVALSHSLKRLAVRRTAAKRTVGKYVKYNERHKSEKSLVSASSRRISTLEICVSGASLSRVFGAVAGSRVPCARPRQKPNSTSIRNGIPIAFTSFPATT